MPIRRLRTGALLAALVAAPFFPPAAAAGNSERTMTQTPTATPSAPGLIVSPSRFGPKETMDRLVAAVTEAGIGIAARIDHAAAAAKAGLTLRPTEVLVFGNPKAGTPVMQAIPTIAIDLPLKALVWQDEEGRTWLAVNDPVWLAERHGGPAGTEGNLRAMAAGLAALAARAAGASP